jgi:membrane protein YdbS with pleckstrin-like domain
VLLRLLRVPAEPALPDGAANSVRVFRAGRNYLLWRLLVWGVFHLSLLLLLVFPVAVQGMRNGRVHPALSGLAGIGGIVLAGMAYVSYQTQRLNYEQRWYIVTDRSLRIRSGIWNVQEITMTFANVQEMRIQADPLQVVLGIADLVVRSAGGGGAAGQTGAGHVARLSGVDNAEELREVIGERLKRYRDAGLGDRGDVDDTPVEAAKELLAEAKRLRAAVV